MRNGEESGGGFRPPSGQQNVEGESTGEPSHIQHRRCGL